MRRLLATPGRTRAPTCSSPISVAGTNSTVEQRKKTETRVSLNQTLSEQYQAKDSPSVMTCRTISLVPVKSAFVNPADDPASPERLRISPKTKAGFTCRHRSQGQLVRLIEHSTEQKLTTLRTKEGCIEKEESVHSEGKKTRKKNKAVELTLLSSTNFQAACSA